MNIANTMQFPNCIEYGFVGIYNELYMLLGKLFICLCCKLLQHIRQIPRIQLHCHQSIFLSLNYLLSFINQNVHLSHVLQTMRSDELILRLLMIFFRCISLKFLSYLQGNGLRIVLIVAPPDKAITSFVKQLLKSETGEMILPIGWLINLSILLTHCVLLILGFT